VFADQPHVALVDFHLRGEDSSGLIARLREESVPVIMLSGSFEFPAPVSPEGVTMVEKPISEAQILQYLKPILKAGRYCPATIAPPLGSQQ
jgi:DNA-binding response OmpR family regulator